MGGSEWSALYYAISGGFFYSICESVLLVAVIDWIPSWGNGTQSLRANSLLLMDTLRVCEFSQAGFHLLSIGLSSSIGFCALALSLSVSHTHKRFYNLSLLLYIGYLR